MSKLTNFLFILFISIGLFSSVFSYNIKTLDTQIDQMNMSVGEVSSYWQACIDDSNDDDNVVSSRYVGDTVNPYYYYYYTADNSNWAKSVLDISSMIIYNPSTFVNNGIFNLYSNITLNGGNSRITKSSYNIGVIGNQVGRHNLAGLFVLKGKYQTILLGSNTTSNFLGYRTDFGQNIPFYVNRNYSLINTPTTNHSCIGYYVAKCGDGVLDNVNKQGGANTDGKYGILIDGEIIEWGGLTPNEQCDPADPSHEGWGNQGCSNTCQAINQNINPPTCTLGYVNIGNSQFLIYWNIIGSFYTPTNINIIPNTLVQSSYSVLTNTGQWVGVSPLQPGTYTARMTVTNQGGSNNCQTTFTLNAPDEKICGDGNIDVPNDNGFNEQCDDGNSINTDGCKNNCTLNTPSCTLSVNPQVQDLGESVIFTATKSSWAVYQSFDLDNGTILNNNINFPYNYTYNNIGNYNPVLTVRNNYSPIANGVSRPTMTCNTNLEIVQQLPELNLNKILITTNPVGIGDFVDYRIELTNNGQGVAHNVYLRDQMPASLELISYSIAGISNYQVNDWQDTNGNWFVEYSDFDLNPGQTAVMTLRGKVRTNPLPSQTTNCAFTVGDYDCEIYQLSNDPYIVKYQKNASATNNSMAMSVNDMVFENESDNASHKSAQPGDLIVEPNTYTTGDIVVNFGDIIKYRVKFGNNGATYTNGGVRVVDYMPACVDYVTASIQGIVDANFVQTQDAQGRWVLEYNGFDLNAGQQGYMLVEGQIKNTPECQNVDTYINNAYIYFENPLRVEHSSTTAMRINGEANVYKDSDVDVHMPNDDKIFDIWVTNNTPNPITNLILQDVWPSGPCIEYVNRNGSGFTKDPNALTWNYAGPLAAGQSVIMHINAHILNNATCVNPDYVNIVNLTYTEAGSQKYDQASYHFSVIGTPFANVSLVKTADKTVVSSGDVITYTILYQNNGNVSLNNYVLTDIWPAMVDLTMASPFPNSTVVFSTGSILKWIFNTPLLPGASGRIVLTGVVQ